MAWSLEEMHTLNLGNACLNKRLIKLFDQLSHQPEASMPVACAERQETKAAYRFFDNKQVTPDKILQPHINAALERIKQHPVALLIQDTTTLNFTGQKQRSDIGLINHEKHLGLLLHPTIAVTPQKVCLGIMDTEHWAREKIRHRTPREKSRENHKIPITEKESDCWVRGYHRANTIAQQVPETMIISVADREAHLTKSSPPVSVY